MHNNQTPAYLFVGSDQQTIEATIAFLQQRFCFYNQCTKCIICNQIQERQHHATLWLKPEKRYTLEDIEIIFEKTMLCLDPSDSFFFIITKADLLTTACANRLLKLIEEPPHGYHFIFLTERQAQILPTIASRCVQKNFSPTRATQEVPPLIAYFMRLGSDPVAFTQEVSKCTLTEEQSMIYIDDLLTYWIAAHKKAINNLNTQEQAATLHMITILKEALTYPPCPGSAKIFWKNLFLKKEQ
jgi:DNA polymerase III delta prime subunit